MKNFKSYKGAVPLLDIPTVLRRRSETVSQLAELLAELRFFTRVFSGELRWR